MLIEYFSSHSTLFHKDMAFIYSFLKKCIKNSERKIKEKNHKIHPSKV